MADLQFIESQDYQNRRALPPPSFLTRIVLSTGIVETERGAQYVLLTIAAVAFIAMLYVASTSVKSPPPPPSPFFNTGVPRAL